MITKEYLDEYEKNKKNFSYEVNKLEKDIQFEYSNTTTDSVRGSSRSYPYIERHIEINGIDENRIKKLKKRKKNFKKRLKKIDKELQYKLNNLEDKLMAEIIEKKYIKKMEWKQISISMNYANESGTRNYFNRYFEKI